MHARLLSLAALLALGCSSSSLPPGGTGGSPPGTGGSASGGAAGGNGGGPPATGGVASGGSVGASGGRGGAAAGGASGSGTECTQDSDCVLQDDCCGCQAIPKTAVTATCNIECFASECAAHRITAPTVACVAGRCVMALSCNSANVACTIVQPSCATGSLPVIANNCYTGACLPAQECSDVASCEVCTAAGLACVTDEVLGGPTHHCVTIPAACPATPTCGCLGACTGAFQCADPTSTTPVCQCPTC